MKINESGVDLSKALGRSNQNSFELRDITEGVQRQQAQPKLLTSMLGGTANSVFLTTKTFEYDELETTLQLPTGKRYDEYGNTLTKDKGRSLSYTVGSFGTRMNVAPADYAGKRIPFSEELMNEAYLVAQMNAKDQKAWAAFEELMMAQLITAGTNITLDGPQPVYDYHQDILGSARPAAIAMDLTNTAVDHFQNGAEVLDVLEERAEKTFNTVSMPVAICGKDYFFKRLEVEKQQGGGGSLVLNREMRGMDLASMGVPEENFGTGGIFNYQYFDSHDGIRYVRYSASITGTKLIADDKAYLVPVGAENFIKMVYAPAQTREYVNTVAQAKYGWSKEDDRQGVTMWTEKNVLPVLVNPDLIIELKAGA